MEQNALSEPAILILDDRPRMQPLESLSVRLFPRDDDTVLRDKWLGMEAISEHTFFTSWHWISCWLGTVQAEVLQCEARMGDELVGLGLFVETLEIRGLIPLRRLWLHKTGRRAQDRIGIEWNDLLIKRGMESRARKGVIGHLINRPRVDEVVFGLTGDGHDAGVAGPGIVASIGRSDPVPWVDLGRVAAQGGYDLALSSKNRNNVRRSQRKAEAMGKLEVRSAATVDEALRFFREAGPYHIERFKDGKPDRRSGYLNPAYVAFHEKLIGAVFGRGLVDLVKITAGEAVLAYMYYFVYGKTVYAYQSAVNFASHGNASDGKMSPGLLANYLCIRKFADQGMEKFDFLAGDYYYKQALATDSGWMRFYKYSKPSLKMSAVEKLLAFKRRLFGTGV
ncbi:MAG: GNAT family N-acetyltransferase [Fibrobacteria bacterium]